MSNADIKGSIPGMIKNELAKKQGEVAAKIEEVMKAEKKWGIWFISILNNSFYMLKNINTWLHLNFT